MPDRAGLLSGSLSKDNGESIEVGRQDAESISDSATNGPATGGSESSPTKARAKDPSSSETLLVEKRQDRAPERRRTKIDHHMPANVIMHHVLDEKLEMLANAPRSRPRLSTFAWAALTGLTGSITGGVHGIANIFSTDQTNRAIVLELAEMFVLIGFVTATVIAVVQPKENGKTAEERLAEIRAQKDKSGEGYR